MPGIEPHNTTVNPLVGLSSAALYLYSALGVFRNKDLPPKAEEWFRAPRLHHRLRRFASLSKEEIDQGLEELMKAELLQMRSEGKRWWYRLN
jgi:hypothetical protein